MVHHIVMWKFKPEVEDAKKPELKKAMAENLKHRLHLPPMIWHLSQHWKKQRM